MIEILSGRVAARPEWFLPIEKALYAPHIEHGLFNLQNRMAEVKVIGSFVSILLFIKILLKDVFSYRGNQKNKLMKDIP